MIIDSTYCQQLLNDPVAVNDQITQPKGKGGSIAAQYGKAEVIAMKEAVDMLDYGVNWPTK